MGLSVDSKIKVIMKNPAGAAVIEKYSPGFSQNPQLKMIQGLTWRKLAAFPESKEAGMTDEVVEAIDAELRAIED